MAPQPFSAKESAKRCRQFRRKILEVSQQVTALHMGPAFSAMETMDVIYHYLADAPNTGPNSDAFVLSKGHGCMAQYVILHALGILKDKDLDNFCTAEGVLGVHPDLGVPGIAASTGSLGHGFGMSVGIAHANRLLKNNAKTFVIISDGELQEGSTWEACMMASNLKLSNLVLFVDLNNRITMGKLDESHPAIYPVVDKFKAFGWNACAVDGHDAKAVYEAGTNLHTEKPTVVVCNTVKAKGVSYMEDVPIWHYRSPNPEEFAQAMSELAEVEEGVQA